jgi:pimeloyl-ACP methyl ester carboxylesterase
MPYVTVAPAAPSQAEQPPTIFYAQSPSAAVDLHGRHNLLLLHGAGGNHLVWPPELRRLAGANVYALDLPGHGRSPGGGRRTIAAYADAVALFVAALKLPQVALAGHSMGGAIALELALRGPTWLSRLVLLGSGARLRPAPAYLAGLEQDYLGTLRRFTRYAYGPATPEEMVHRGWQLLRQCSPAVLRDDFAACAAFDVTGRLGEVKFPALIVCGASDRITPPDRSQYLREQIAGASLLIVEEAGHMVMLEKPLAVAGAVAEFLRGN